MHCLRLCSSAADSHSRGGVVGDQGDGPAFKSSRFATFVITQEGRWTVCTPTSAPNCGTVSHGPSCSRSCSSRSVHTDGWPRTKGTHTKWATRTSRAFQAPSRPRTIASIRGLGCFAQIVRIMSRIAGYQSWKTVNRKRENIILFIASFPGICQPRPRLASTTCFGP